MISIKPIMIGILASFFFAFTFIFNRAMDLSGGSWVWSASLRYLFMIPFLIMIVLIRGNLVPLIKEMKSRPLQWFLWSLVGFGLFYVPLTFAAGYGPGWLVAGTWQLTIVSGSLLAPLFYRTVSTKNGEIRIRENIPVRGLFLSSFILVGVVLLQTGQGDGLSGETFLLCFLPVLFASFAYPLGNRKMMEVTGGRIMPISGCLG